MLNGLQVLHNYPGGLFEHTDIQPRQFMLDNENRILINDFNRGKFKEYYFKKDNNIIIPCKYCMPNSHGHYRAPEEVFSDVMDESIDIWSIALSIYKLFSFSRPFHSIKKNNDAIKYLYHDLQLKPKLYTNIPPFIQDILRQMIRHNPINRPNINYVIRQFRYFYKNIKQLSDNKQHMTLKQLRKIQAFRLTNYPDIKQIKKDL